MQRKSATIIRQIGPVSGIERIHGVTFDGRRIWFAADDKLVALDEDRALAVDSIACRATAGSAFDGTHIFQIADLEILKIDPASGKVLASIPVPGGARASGLAWGEGSLWVGQKGDQLIHRLDPESGKLIGSLQVGRHVTGVTWHGAELWHGSWEPDESGLWRIDPVTGEAIEAIDFPAGAGVSGIESNGVDRFFCGGGNEAVVRVVAR